MAEPTEPPLGRRALSRGRRALGHLRLLFGNAVPRLLGHRGTQLAAGMSYYALFSVFPTAIVLAAIAGFVLDDPGAREEAVNFLLEELPLSDDQGRNDIESLLDGVTRNSGALGLVGLLALLISASALISAARNSVNVAFEEEARRGALRGKGLDLLLILGVGLLFVLSFAVTLFGQLDIELDGRVGDAIKAMVDATGVLLPIALAALVFGVLYTVLPTRRPPLRDVWPGVAVAAVGYELLKSGFSFYLENFANYSAVYGSLGAVIAFMFFVYLASLVFLLGAEMAAIWPGVRAGYYDPDPADPDAPLSERVRSVAAGLLRSGRSDEDQGPGA